MGNAQQIQPQIQASKKRTPLALKNDQNNNSSKLSEKIQSSMIQNPTITNNTSISNNISIEIQHCLYKLANFYKNHNKNSLAAHYFCLYVRKIEEAGMDDSDLAFETYLFLAKFFKEEEKYELAEDYAKEALRGESTKEEAKHILKSIEETGHRIEQEVS